MADSTSLILLVSLPCLLLCGFFTVQRNTTLLIGSVLFCSALLFGVGAALDAGQPTANIFVAMFLLSLISMPVYVILLFYFNLKDSTMMVGRALRQ